jgi:hypothetical protein
LVRYAELPRHHTCGACTGDTQCANDATYGTAKPICETTTGATKIGQCVANPATTGSLCTVSTVVTNNVTCPVNSADFCCGGKCLAGNCCVDADCSSLGANFNCLQNTCTQCNSVVGYAYFVDPINGDDTGATGSNMSGTSATPGCSFRTLTKAIDVITHSGAVPAHSGTTITIVGQSATSTTSLYTVAAGGITAEILPITVPANVIIKTNIGPVMLTVPANKTGFSLVGDNAGIVATSAAALTIDGASHTGSIGVEVVAGASDTASLSYVKVINTKGDGIQVTSGTATLGAGITVTDAGANGINISGGTATINSGLSVIGAGTNGINISGGTANIGAGVSVTTSIDNGLNISGGTATITVTTNQTSTAFDSNGQYGIAVSGTGVLNIAGAIPATGNAVRTVSAKNNTGSNVYFHSTAAGSAVKYFYSYSSGEDGMKIVGGSKIQVRNSVFRSNHGDGIHIVSGTTSVLTDIDLGTDFTSTTDGARSLLRIDGPSVAERSRAGCKEQRSAEYWRYSSERRRRRRPGSARHATPGGYAQQAPSHRTLS